MRCRCSLLLCLVAIFAPSLGAEPGALNSTNSGPAFAQIPSSIDLRSTLESFGLRPRVQGARPTCSVFTLTEALEFAVAKKQGQTPRLSVEFLNWASNKACDDSQDGGFFSDLWKGFAAYGICSESEMGYEAKFEPTRLPSAAALGDAKMRLSLGLQLHWLKRWDVTTGLERAELAAIKQTLANGWPVCAGLRWPKREAWVEGVLQPCSASEVRDGHSILLVGYHVDSAQPGGGVFLFRNTSNGGRDGAMPFAYAREFVNDAVWID